MSTLGGHSRRLSLKRATDTRRVVVVVLVDAELVVDTSRSGRPIRRRSINHQLSALDWRSACEIFSHSNGHLADLRSAKG